VNVVTFNALGRYGRFANALYQIAGTIGIARRNGFDYAFPEWRNWDHRERFNSTEDIDVEKYFENPLPRYDGPPLPERFVDWGYHDVTLTESTSLSGHMQSERYFEHCIDEARWQLRMKDEPPQNDYVAIHWRAGDYSDGEGYHPRLTMDYYRPAMEEFHGAKFLVFSDDVAGARQMFGSGVEYSEGRDYLEDFKRLKKCRHYIIANSSYSAMAAVLSDAPDKRVVAPRPWFGPRYTQLRADDIYGKNWKVIDWK
jgi:glycosyl transferase family 11